MFPAQQHQTKFQSHPKEEYFDQDDQQPPSKSINQHQIEYDDQELPSKPHVQPKIDVPKIEEPSKPQQTKQKKIECFSCKQLIGKGQYIKAGDLFFHHDHFLCEICHNPPGNSYMEKEKKIYCKNDYLEIFAQKCESCKKALIGKYVNLKEKNYHKECFICCECKKPFEDLNFINALQKNWHRECFKCKTCGEVFMDNKYKIMDGYPYHALCK